MPKIIQVRLDPFLVLRINNDKDGQLVVCNKILVHINNCSCLDLTCLLEVILKVYFPSSATPFMLFSVTYYL